jgi:hypothetical protein
VGHGFREIKGDGQVTRLRVPEAEEPIFVCTPYVEGSIPEEAEGVISAAVEVMDGTREGDLAWRVGGGSPLASADLASAVVSEGPKVSLGCDEGRKETPEEVSGGERGKLEGVKVDDPGITEGLVKQVLGRQEGAKKVKHVQQDRRRPKRKREKHKTKESRKGRFFKKLPASYFLDSLFTGEEPKI